MRIAHISDTHLGYRQYNLNIREQDYYNAFNEAIDKMIEERVDVLIHSGDLFDTPNPPIKALHTLKNALKKIDGKIKVITVLGEHDIPKRKAMIPHRIFDMHILGRYELESISINNVLFAGISNLKGRYVNHLKQELNRFDSIAAGHKKSVLILHQALKRYLPFEGSYELTLDDLPKSANYYALGHIHSRVTPIKFGNGLLAYSGSTEITGKDEIQSWAQKGKGFYIIDLDEEVNLEFIKLDIRPQLNLSIDIKDIDTIKDLLAYDAKPLLHLTLFGDILDKGRVYMQLQEMVRDKVVYFKPFFRVGKIREIKVPKGPINYQEIFNEYFGVDKIGEFANALLEYLSKNDIDSSIELAKAVLDEGEVIK